MPLLLPGLELGRTTLEDLYREHREGLAGMARFLEEPGVAVTDAGRRMLGLDVARDSLRIFPEDPSGLSVAELIDRVNLSYDLMISVIEMSKLSLDVPKVPRSKKS